MKNKFVLLLLTLAWAHAAFATVHIVNVSGISFSPANITIQQGDTVRWIKPAGGFHNVEESNGQPPVFTSGEPTSSAFTYNFAFNAPLEGLYNYECVVHAGSGMVGTVTVEAGGSAPDAPSNPIPPSGATEIILDPAIGWTSGGADHYTVRFGTTNPPPVVAQNVVNPVYAPEGLVFATQYFWQVTAINDFGSTDGPVWSFTTVTPPDQVTGPFPADDATNVPVTTFLGWEPALDADSYQVFFGTSEPLPMVTETANTTFDPAGDLLTSTQYLWRVDAVNEAGTTAGLTWSFTTEAGSAAGEVVAPRDFALAQAYPNPFNGSVNITLAILQDAFARVAVYDLLGREVAVLANGRMSVGLHQLAWNASGNAGGLYFLKCECAGMTQTQKLVYMP